MARKIFPRLARIARDGVFQRLDALEPLLVAQLLEEAHAQVLAIEVTLPVENMHLQQRLRDRVDGRAPAEARYAASQPGSQPLHFHDEDPCERRRPAKDDIGGRESELAAKLGPVRHRPADRIRMPGQALGPRAAGWRE